MTAARTLRFGIAGVAASVGESRAIVSHPHCTVTAAAARTQASLDRFREQFPCDVYFDVEAMCKAPNVDAIFVGTPTHFHVEHTLMAVENGKHVILSKPMATSLEDAQRVVDAVDRNGVTVVVGHTQVFEPPVAKIREIVAGGQLGRLGMINTWYYTDWMYRGRVPEEYDTSQGGGVVYRQGAHQFDIVRWIGGGRVRSVRAMTGIWDLDRPTEGCYAAFLEFEDGAVATCVFNGFDHFHTHELGFGIGEGGQKVVDHEHAEARLELLGKGEAAAKAGRRGGARQGGGGERERFHAFYGLTLVSCEHGDIRQSPKGVLVYGDEELREVEIPRGTTGRDVMVAELYEAAVNGKPASHDARWGMATLEVQLAVIESGQTRREVQLSHQVPTRE